MLCYVMLCYLPGPPIVNPGIPGYANVHVLKPNKATTNTKLSRGSRGRGTCCFLQGGPQSEVIYLRFCEAGNSGGRLILGRR